MCPILNNAALFHDDDPVHAGDGGQPVGNGDDGLVLHRRLKRGLNLGLNLAIECACRLVQNQDGPVFQKRAGKGDALALAARQLDPPFAQTGVITFAPLMIAEVEDKVMGGGTASGVKHLIIRGVGATVADIGEGRAIEHRGLLPDHGDLPAQGGLREITDIGAIQQNTTLFHLIKAQQEGGNGGFSGARSPHQRHLLSGGHIKIKAGQGRDGATVGKGDPLKPDGTLRGDLRLRPGAIGDFMRHGEGGNAILDLTNVGVDADRSEGDAVGDLAEARRHHGGHGDVAGTRLPLRPQP